MFLLRRSFPALLLSSFLLAQVSPLDAQDTPLISAENAGGLKPALEKPMEVWRLKQGPQSGELMVFTPVYKTEDKPLSGLRGWKILVINESNLEVLRTVSDGGSRAVDGAAAHDGHTLTWRSDGHQLTIQDPEKKNVLRLNAGQSPESVVVSPDGKTIATGGYFAGLKVWTRGGALKHTLDVGQPGGITLVFSPDGKTLAAGNRNDQTRLFDVATGERLRNLPWPSTHELAFHPDGKSLAIAYVDGDLGVWDVATGKLVAQRSTGNELYTLDWNADGTLLATAGAEGKIIVWKVPEYEKVAELDGDQYVMQVRFITGGTKLLMAGSTRIDKDNIEYKLTVWSVGE
jgi:WD40 repeat protein